MREKGGNHFGAWSGLYGGGIKTFQASSQSFWRFTTDICDLALSDGTQHLILWPNLAISGQSRASNGPVADSRYLNLVIDHTEATHNKSFLSISHPQSASV
ncbi:hypothetical protein TNCV_1175871 [Trichonephila clavipes]|nr:hypothetical protein TNCV_1175871 [Trichonephila clavipes]